MDVGVAAPDDSGDELAWLILGSRGGKGVEGRAEQGEDWRWFLSANKYAESCSGEEACHRDMTTPCAVVGFRAY